MLTEIINEFNSTFSVVPAPAALARLLAAIVLAGLIGLERERREKPASPGTALLPGPC